MTDPFTRVDISRSALQANAERFARLAGPSKFMAVVKSNAYGHGLEIITRLLRGRAGWFGTANLDEALAVRALDRTTPILVLSYFRTSDWLLALTHRIELPIFSLEQLRELDQRLQRSRRPIACQVKLDVGTTRIGLRKPDLPAALKILRRNAQLRLTGVFSHFADAENPDQAFTNQQNRQFKELCATIERALGLIKYKHIACTAAALLNPATRHDLIRIGIGVYGLWPDPKLEPIVRKKLDGFRLDPVLTWKTSLLAIKRVPKGTTVGYGRTARVRKPITVGVLPIGYNDGFDRGFSNCGIVLVGNKPAPVLGRVCMNLTMIDLSGVRTARPGDPVTLLGQAPPPGRGVVAADALAKRIGTISYEIVTRIPASLPRVVVA